MSQYNVLILLSDQQRFDTIHKAGYEHMITPALDALAEEGTLCVNAFSGNPVCMPARHDLITGLPARVHGYYGNNEKVAIRDYGAPTLPRIFSEAGYRTAAIGKMHFSPAREHHGFGEMRLMEELPKIRQNDEYAMFLKEQGLDHIQNPHGVRPHIYHIPQNAQQPNDLHGTRWVAEESINWLKENERHPFFLMCGFIQPHPPWNIPNEYDHLYDSKEIPKAIEKSRLPFEDETKAEWFGDDDTDRQREQIRKAYYTAVSMVDESTGKIIQYLKDTKQWDNTLVIYTSDHGEMLQDKGYYSKELPYDSAVRVPLIIKYPKGFCHTNLRDDFVDLLDIMPTCLEVCGLTYPDYKGYQPFGKSLLADEKKKYQFAATGRTSLRWVMCCNEKYKYIYHYMDGYEELYEIGKPEVINLIIKDREKYTDVIVELKQQAIAYEEKWGIEGGVVNGEFVKLPKEVVNPSVRGKFHLWSNNQMQKFFEPELYDRGEVLKKEMVHAVSNLEKSGVQLKEVFNDKEWIEQFNDCFKTYTNQLDNAKFPFKEEESYGKA